MRVILAADRSAGHILPALILARYLNVEEEVYLFLTSSYFKQKLSGKVHFILLGKELHFRNIFLELFYRFGEAIFLLLKVRPKKIVGFGGRGSFFLVVLGSLFFLDTAIYEPNVSFGKANRILKFFVKKIYSGFGVQIRGKKVERIGIPLHFEIKPLAQVEARKRLGLDLDKPAVFCFGGSQGASFLNRIFTRLVERNKGGFSVIHLTGERDYYYYLEFYGKIGAKRYFVKDFCDEISLLYSAADILISRSGALTCAEVAYFKVPVLFIPHPGAGFHQGENAKYFSEREAAYVFSQNDFSFKVFTKIFDRLLKEPDLRTKIADNLRVLNIWTDSYKFQRRFPPFIYSQKPGD